MNHQIMMVYLAIGIIYISVHLRITPQAKLNKIMQELREVFNEAPDTWHPILSLFTSIIFIFILDLREKPRHSWRGGIAVDA